MAGATSAPAKQEKDMKRKTTRSDKTVIWVLSGACVLALIAVIVLLFVPMGTKTAAFTPPEFDPGAVAGEPEVPDDLGWSEIAIREGYKVKVCGVLNANADGSLPLWFYSEADNELWVKLRVLDAEGNTLGETGLLRPGEYVERVQLNELAASGAVKLHVMGYEQNSYYSAGAVDFQTMLQVEN